MRGLLVASLASVLAAACAGAASAGSNACDLAVVIHPAEGLAAVSEAAGANATFAGTVAVSKVGYLTGVVDLKATVSSGWNVSTSPERVEVAMGNATSFNFTANVSVPAAQPGVEPSVLVVTATGQMGDLPCTTAQAQAVVGADVYYGQMAGTMTPSAVRLVPSAPRTVVNVNVSQSTNWDGVGPSAIVTVADAGGLAVGAPTPITLSQHGPLTAWTTFNLTIDAANATPGARDIHLRIRSNAYGLASNETEASVDLVARVVVDATIEDVQFWGAVALGALAAVAAAFWAVKLRRGKGDAE